MDIADSDIPVFIRRRRPVRDSLVFLYSHVYSIVLLTVLWFAFALPMVHPVLTSATRDAIYFIGELHHSADDLSRIDGFESDG